MKKIIKLSVAAALAATAMNAAVVDNVKMSGKAKLWYETNDSAGNSYFDQANSTGQVMIDVAASADIGPVKINLENTTATTLGLEQAVVSASRVGGSTDTQNYTGIANISTTIGGTTLVAGKQALNTPFCFTEAWNAHKNTFNAGVLVNNSLIPNTTIVLADVKTTNALDITAASTAAGEEVGAKGQLTYDGEFNTDLNAKYVGLTTKIAGATVNASFTDVDGNNHASVKATGTWIDAAAKVANANVKVTYAELDPATGDTSNAHAIAVSTKVAGLNVMAAYSKVSDDNNGLAFGNIATTFKKTKLPTAGVYTDGQYVAQMDSKAMKIKVSGIKLGSVALAAQYVDCDNDTTAAKNTSELDVFATTKIAGIATKVIYMHRDMPAGTTGGDQDKIRVIASYSF